MLCNRLISEQQVDAHDKRRRRSTSKEDEQIDISYIRYDEVGITKYSREVAIQFYSITRNDALTVNSDGTLAVADSRLGSTDCQCV